MFQCRACARVFGSDVLLQLVPSRCNVAYDVLVFIGQALCQRHRTTEEVRTDLAARNGPLCASEVELRWRTQVFDTLRKATRIAPPGGQNGLNDDGTAKAMSTARE